MRSLRELIRHLVLEEMMTTTPATSWANATPLGKRDDDPWHVEQGPFEPAKNTGGHASRSGEHVELGDEDDACETVDDDSCGVGSYWEDGYYSNPTMWRDR